MSDEKDRPDSGPPADGDKPDAAKPAPDQPAPDQPAPDQPAPDQPAPDQPAPDQPAGGEAAADQDAEAEAKAAAAAKAKAQAAAAARAKAAAEAEKDPWETMPEAPEWLEADDDELAAAVRERFGEAMLSAKSYAGDLTLEIAAGVIAEVAGYLKDEHGYTYLIDLCGADYPDAEQRFQVIYMLHRFAPQQRRIRLKVATDEATPVPTVCAVWTTANWMEREAYDMYGVRFDGHPDMTRILLWEGFNGYPLRKDFPVEGIDTGSAIYPEYYTPEAGPVAGTGTGWKAPEPPEPEPDVAPAPAPGPEAAAGEAQDAGEPS